MSHDDWMGALASHVGRMRSAYPDDELAIVFDIDGTIVDTRHLVVHVLLSYDRQHGTDLFRGITASDVVEFARRLSIGSSIRSRFLNHSAETFGSGTSSMFGIPRPSPRPTVPTRGFSAQSVDCSCNHGRTWLSTPGVRSRCASSRSPR